MLKKILYTFWIFIFAILLFLSIKNNSFRTFITYSEYKTFDLRQNLLANSGYNKPNKDIVIIAIDDASYEFILDKYGEWPLRRDIYANIVDKIEEQNPKSIAFDLMFVKSIKSSLNADKALVEIFKKYDNVYTAMNLDNQEKDLRIPQQLPDKLDVKVKNNSTVDIDYYEYTNCRTILSDIINATSNIGMINVIRSDDGVLRKMPLFLSYQNKYYPQLGLKVALNQLNLKDLKIFEIEKNSKLKLNNKEIFVDNDGSVILNWYGPTGTFKHIPLYKIIKSINSDTFNKDFDFRNKIIYFGATASSLFDIKTTPVDKVYPGVEVQTTYVNNVLDNNFIKKATLPVNMLIVAILIILTIVSVFLIESMPIATALLATIYAAYIVMSYYIMMFTNTWIEIVFPLTTALFAFIFGVICKYLIKSRDFDQQYKLATTDGLTELYNHRYFQEQMQMFVQHAKRYENEFSLMILDIDYFKRFNDNFGHQSGDAVLKQVANVLKKNVRSSDIVCRYGGEEMSIILPNTTYNEAVKIAEKLCTIIAESEYKLSNNRQSNVTVSIGVSSYGPDGDTPSIIIEAADKRLYNAKNNGRNRVN